MSSVIFRSLVFSVSYPKRLFNVKITIIPFLLSDLSVGSKSPFDKYKRRDKGSLYGVSLNSLYLGLSVSCKRCKGRILKNQSRDLDKGNR